MRFSRSRLLLGSENIERLKNTHAAVFGIGGVGSYTAEALARAGIGEISLFDCDIVDITNVNRQIYALNSTVGKLKTETARTRILDINPECKINIFSDLLTDENISSFFNGFTHAVDAIDTVSAKSELIYQLSSKKITFISSMGSANKMNPEKVYITDISKTHNCPLARVMRKKLKEKNIYKNVPVVFSDEIFDNGNIIPEIKNEITGKRPQGTISYMPAVFGLYAASFIIRKIVEK
ncbi:MAG: tRNA threonylcarbamoyladenosine dehydratase [Spirochaetes bacterium]|nr:tRNA threonylcarbamoyladenosine dehydratase [Spirochaetota bacterium]